MARALIVGCGCRGRTLAAALLESGWVVRGTTRDETRLKEIAATGAEAALADPGQLASLLDHVGDVTVAYWLLGSAQGDPGSVAALHDERLERLLEELVDTPVRGFVYEGAGTVDPDGLEAGAAIVRAASARWRIPVEVVESSPSETDTWRDAMVAAATRLAGG
jgi:uncharacterized protein YbjT (DUF2867 family)